MTTKDRYVEDVLSLHEFDLENVCEVYLSAGYERDIGESDIAFIARCAEQDFDDGAYGGALYQELIDEDQN